MESIVKALVELTAIITKLLLRVEKLEKQLSKNNEELIKLQEAVYDKR